MRFIAAGCPLLKVQRSVASQDDEWQVPAAGVTGLQNLTGCSGAVSDAQASMMSAFGCSCQSCRKNLMASSKPGIRWSCTSTVTMPT